MVRTDIALNDRRAAKRHAAKLLRSGHDEAPDPTREPELAAVIAEGRAELAATQTSSVSRVAEDIRLVPATIYVVSAQQIRDRGYVDLEAVLRDVPGIDFSRGNGVSYSNLYMRGLRTDSSDRILFLIDGIEQNELHTNVAYISRQFSLSEIERVEVVYGPASTLYGANAYAGVINVVTRDGSKLLREHEVFGLRMDAGFGGGTRQMNSRVIDGQMVLSDKKRRFMFSVAGRFYAGQEQDLSEFSTWDFESSRYDAENQEHFYGELYDLPEGETPGSWTQSSDQDGKYRLTDAKQEELRLADLANFEAEDYRDLSRDWSLRTKLQLGRRFEVGASGWSRLEGHSGWLRETAAPSITGRRWNPSGTLWHPRMWAVHARYSDRVTPTVSLTLFARYTTHDLGPRTRWYTHRRPNPRSLVDDPALVHAESLYTHATRYRNSSMLRSEMFASYRPNSWVSIVGGGDLRYGRVQGNYRNPDTIQTDDEGNAAVGQDSQIGDQRLLWALGAFATLSVNPIKQLTISGGLRYDYGRSDGYVIYQGRGVLEKIAGVFSPRAAIVFATKKQRLIAKLFYSRAFFNPTNWQRYSSSSTRDPSPYLDFETANNVEASVQGTIGEDPTAAHRVLLGGSLYGTFYEDIHQLRTVDGETTFLDHDTRVLGNQSTLEYRYKGGLGVFASYSYTFARTRAARHSGEDNTGTWDPTTHIAPHKGTVGVRIQPLQLMKDNGSHRIKRSNIVLSLRTNIVGRRNGFCARLEGEGAENSWEELPQDEIDRCRSYTTINGALTYSYNTSYGVWWVQVSGLNLLNYQYSDPGVREAAIYAPAHPQPGISGFGRIGFEF
ncbi:MAG: TonB-dependent receptor [Myxococcota bacterium]